MPIHIAPALRAREEALENAGLEVPLNSAGVLSEIVQENAGTKGKIKHNTTYNYNGSTYKQ